MSESGQDATGDTQGKNELTLNCSKCGQAFGILASQKEDIVECPHCGLHVQAAELIGGPGRFQGACPQCEAETSIVVPDEVADQQKLLVTCDQCGKDASVEAFIRKREKLEAARKRAEFGRAEREAVDRRREEQIKRHAAQLEQQREASRAEWERRRTAESVNQITPPADRETKSLVGILRALATVCAILSCLLFFISMFGFVSLPESIPFFFCLAPAFAFATYWLMITIGAKALSHLGSIAQGIERIDRRLDAQQAEISTDQNS